jgi:hypothetical protein
VVEWLLISIRNPIIAHVEKPHLRKQEAYRLIIPPFRISDSFLLVEKRSRLNLDESVVLSQLPNEN